MLFLIGLVGVFVFILANELNTFLGNRKTPQETADELNKYSLTRGCNKCGSKRYRYHLGTDELICMDCGAADDRKWVLEHPELSK